MHSREKPCRYARNQLGEVICQLRFPEIPAISVHEPEAFRASIREMFPNFEIHRQPPQPRLAGQGEQLHLEPGQPVPNYSFFTEGNTWRVNLTSRFFSLSCREYGSWEEFARMLDRPLAEFIRQYEPACFERMGLRYLNFISRRSLELEDVPFRELLKPWYLGILSDPAREEPQIRQAGVDAELILPGSCRARIHSGTGYIRTGQGLDPEIKLVFDQDVFLPGQMPAKFAPATLQMLHEHAWHVFRGAITDRLHEAMEPNQS